LKSVLIIAILFLISNTSFGQSVELFGRVESVLDNENIHVINRTAQLFTTTNNNGEFLITVKLNDTLSFSSIQHEPKDIIISKEIILNNFFVVKLDEQINQLDEVLVGKVLLRDLRLDVQNTEDKAPINFYDVGIPGYKGKPATQSERRLHEATTGSGIVPLNPILNAISGRTKMLKNQIKIEEKDKLMRSIKARLFNDFFESNHLADDFKMEFFYFCMDDVNFIKTCKNKSDLEVLTFLQLKYKQYQDNRSLAKE
jgi:hypothetical protein